MTGWAARLPSAVLATLMVFFIYVWARRFRRGMQLDAALITAASAIIIGFGRGASTDMPLTAMFTIAMLSWWGWYESQNRAWLLAFYAFAGLGTLAKGPIAVFLAGLIIVAFAALRRDWRLVLRTLWLPGIVLYLAVVLPWFIAVQRANPEFFRVFILEHNLARYATDLYRHKQPFWYYVPVALIGLCRGPSSPSPRLVDAIRDWRFSVAEPPGQRRPANVPRPLVPAADRVLLAVAVEVAGIHSAGDSRRRDFAGRFRPAPRSRKATSPASGSPLRTRFCVPR